MEDQLKSLEQKAGKRRNFDSPPLHLWNPPLSGDIAILITADGSWYHEGGRIERESLVGLFASILRREEDGEYYLVTPGEKWRVEVERHPLVVTDVSESEVEDGGVLEVTLNTGRTVPIDKQHPLFLDGEVGDIAAVELDHGLSALFTRAAWYRLVEMAEEYDGVPCVLSGGSRYPLVAVEG